MQKRNNSNICIFAFLRFQVFRFLHFQIFRFLVFQPSVYLPDTYLVEVCRRYQTRQRKAEQHISALMFRSIVQSEN